MVDFRANPFFGDASDKPEGNEWYIKAGLRQHCFPLGHTIWFGEYGQNNDRMNSQVFLSGVTSTQERQWGVGVVQEIDAAAMSVWLGWRHYTADATCTGDSFMLGYPEFRAQSISTAWTSSSAAL